jgi:hypothetical protein
MAGINTLIQKTLKDIGNAVFRREFGQNGFLDIADTNAHVGNFVALKAEGGANAVIATAVTEYGDDLASYTLNPGDIVYGSFTSVTLTSGEVLAYYKNRVD